MNRRGFFGAVAAVAALGILPKKQAKATTRRKRKKIAKRPEPMWCDWIGEGSPGDWNDKRNWRAGAIPQDGDSVRFPGNTTYLPAPSACPTLTLDTVIVGNT